MIAYDEEKLKNLILYVAQKSEGHEYFGAVKLNKILFFADFIAYAKTGKPITGCRYMKQPLGPVPKQLPRLQERMKKGGFCATQKRFITHHEDRLVALREPKLAGFTGEQIAIVDRVIEEFAPLTGNELSKISHLLPAWKAFEIGDDIPYETIFVSDRELTEAEFAFGAKVHCSPASEGKRVPING